MVLYAFGSNGSSQLGIGHCDDVSRPIACRFQESIESAPTKVAAGGNHTIILFSDGQVFVSGPMKRPQYPFAVNSFRRFTTGNTRSSGIKLCSATWEASILVDCEDFIYAFGSGDKGEMGQGTGPSSVDFSSSALISNFLPKATTIVDLASGLQHTVVVLSNGEVYGWGNGRKGQLGQPAGIIPEPRKIEGIHFKVVRAVCGREFTYLIGEPGEGRHAILGADKFSIRSRAPENVPGWKDIGASWGSIFILEESGTIISWGRNDHGQLAPSNLPVIKKMAVGSEHALALTQEGRLLAWGWGEHGNCGEDVDDVGDVKRRWNNIEIKCGLENPTIVGVGAGCATSWLWTIDP
ncbi:hypothetical protein MMC19_004857 [Ptychographa xylographoides]|nr:hypothetical protein [Ptychographa xylographoides]